MKETWKDIFCKKVGSGNYWEDLFEGEFPEHLFLDRSDAVYICKKAQVDAYENIITKLTGKVDDSVIKEIKQTIEDLWKQDDSALGMIVNGKQITD